MSEFETVIGTTNWHLQHRQMMESNRSMRDFQLYPKPNQIPSSQPPLLLPDGNHRVAETNL